MELLLPLATASLPNSLHPPIAVFPNPTHRLSSFRVVVASRRAISTSPGGFPSPFPRSRVVSVSNCVDSPVSSSTGWVVVTETPPGGSSSKSEVVDYYVGVLAGVLGSVKEAQMSIYNVSWQNHYGFCCDVNEEASHRLADVPGVLSVRPDKDIDSAKKDYSFLTSPSSQFSRPNNHYDKFTPAAPGQNSNYWLVQMEKPRIEVVTKAQMVDYYAQTLTKVMGNEKDAQMSMYHISWEEEFGFCCHIDEDCAQELADVRGVLAVLPDLNVNSDYKDYRGVGMTHKSLDSTPAVIDQMPKTKRLFVTGLSFYTSEKTLRAAFEGYGELVEVKIIMDKISKRSKGYAFIEYTTEEAAGAALTEMNGKIINGWMIVVDVAKTNPPRQNRGRIRHSTPPSQN